MLDFLLGPIQHAHGYATNQAGVYTAEDIVTGSFHFNNNIVGQGMWCFTTSHVSDKEVTTIVGNKGQISFPFFGDHSVTVEEDSKGKEIIRLEIPKHIQQPLIQTIVDELRGKGQCPSTGISGARTNKVMESLCRRI
jgi:hypothetical protein